MSTDATVAAPESRLLVGMGGSGIKTLAKFASVLAQHREEAASSELFMAYLLVDTDGGDLREYERQIRETYSPERRHHRLLRLRGLPHAQGGASRAAQGGLVVPH